jgi:hypothetical protein
MHDSITPDQSWGAAAQPIIGFDESASYIYLHACTATYLSDP